MSTQDAATAAAISVAEQPGTSLSDAPDGKAQASKRCDPHHRVTEGRGKSVGDGALRRVDRRRQGFWWANFLAAAESSRRAVRERRGADWREGCALDHHISSYRQQRTSCCPIDGRSFRLIG